MTIDTTKSESGPAMNEPRLGIRKVYLKDMSFESPNTPNLFAETDVRLTKPTMKVGIDKSQTNMGDDLYELLLRVNVHAVLDDGSTLFLIEITQAGIFWLPDHSVESLNRIVHVDCYKALFPFAREAVWTVVTRGGFPSLLLQELDFESLYQQG